MKSREPRIPTVAYVVYAIVSAPIIGCSDDGEAAADTEAVDTDSGAETGDESGGSSTTTSTTTDDSDSSESDSNAGSTGGGSDSDSDDGPPPIPELSPGCGTPFSDEWLEPYTVEWGEESLRATVTASGVEREFLLELPDLSDPNTPHPIMFTFHGYGGAMDNSFGQNVIDYWPEAIAIYPQALANAGGTASWSTAPGGQDESFFIAMLNDLGNRMCIDMNRVIVQGTSDGGRMSNFLGCVRADIVDGIAPAASWFPLSSDQCTGPVPAWILHGRNDNTVSFSSGEQVRDIWLSINGCDGEGEMDERGCTNWNDCSGGAPVVWCPHDGAHDLPRTAGFIDDMYAWIFSL